MQLDVPAPDHEGFVEWVENEYSSDRWSDVYCRKDSKTGGSVFIQSGEQPAYSRFIKDLRPKLYEYGFVITFARSSEKSFDDCHKITATPIMWVVAYVNGLVCNRGACQNVTASGYCDNCSDYFEESDNPNEPNMTNP